MDTQAKLILMSFVCSVILALIIIPILKRIKIGQIERDDGPQSHLKKQGTPTMGGIIFIVAIIIMGIFLYISYRNSDAQMVKRLLSLMLVTVGFGLIGLIDDFKKLVLKNTKGLKPAFKMLGLLVVAVSFVLALVYVFDIDTQIIIPFTKDVVTLPIWLYIPFAVFVMLAATNAVNLTDGIDGLSTSVSTIILTCLTVIAIMTGVQEVTIFGCVMVGIGLGFLLFNLNPAKVFMGDTGSLLLGGAIAAMALYLKLPLLLIIIAVIPVLEAISVMTQVLYFKKTGNRVFKMAPIHHHFELSGWKENKVVSIFSMITLIMCIVGIMAI